MSLIVIASLDVTLSLADKWDLLGCVPFYPNLVVGVGLATRVGGDPDELEKIKEAADKAGISCNFS